VVSPAPVVSLRDVGVTISFFSSLSIFVLPGPEPGAGSNNNDELRASHEEAECPNGREDHEVHLVVGLVNPVNSLGLVFIIL
jgi:hypothetical protein